MDSTRSAHDSNARPEFGPKLMVTGRLKGTFAGRPVELLAERREVCLRVHNLRSVWTLRRYVSSATERIVRRLNANGIRVRLNIGRAWTVEVSPNPHFVIRLLFPSRLRARE
jgi:hypothetical protein